MEYLPGGSLKRAFDYRMNRIRSSFGVRVTDTNSSDTDYDSDCSIQRKSDLLELGKKVTMTEPLFSETEVSAILKSVLKALSPMHDMNFIHRDIKPDNIIVSPTAATDKLMVNPDQSDLKLVDFGFSAPYTLKKWDKLEDNVGTTLFMAPEQIDK